MTLFHKIVAVQNNRQDWKQKLNMVKLNISK
jgi:hypothetical protein